MIIKYSGIISCTSEHPSFPAKNLLEYRPNIHTSTWLCSEPGILVSSLILELDEPSEITGIDIGNSRCCTVEILGSTNSDDDNWTTIIKHEFMSNNDAEDGRFKDQVQLFTKKEISDEITKIVFRRVKVICRQPANRKVLFGLSFLILRKDDKVDADGNLDAFGRFKIKQKNKDDSLDKFKEKYLQQIIPKNAKNFKTELIEQMKEKRALNEEKSDEILQRKRPSLNLNSETLPQSLTPIANSEKEKESNDRPAKRLKISDNNSKDLNQNKENVEKKKAEQQSLSQSTTSGGRARCSLCLGNVDNVLCKNCYLLKEEKSANVKKPEVKASKKPALSKEFGSLFQGVIFSLSGYKNPERDNIRRKAIAMGARYVTDTSNCTHLVCAFKNTPKYNELKGKAKIISHLWIEECFDKKTRFPWRRYALDSVDKNGPESEDEVVAGPAPQPSSIYDRDTDSD